MLVAEQYEINHGVFNYEFYQSTLKKIIQQTHNIDPYLTPQILTPPSIRESVGTPIPEFIGMATEYIAQINHIFKKWENIRKSINTLFSILYIIYIKKCVNDKKQLYDDGILSLTNDVFTYWGNINIYRSRSLSRAFLGLNNAYTQLKNKKKYTEFRKYTKTNFNVNIIYKFQNRIEGSIFIIDNPTYSKLKDVSNKLGRLKHHITNLFSRNNHHDNWNLIDYIDNLTYTEDDINNTIAKTTLCAFFNFLLDNNIDLINNNDQLVNKNIISHHEIYEQVHHIRLFDPEKCNYIIFGDRYRKF